MKISIADYVNDDVTVSIVGAWNVIVPEYSYPADTTYAIVGLTTGGNLIKYTLPIPHAQKLGLKERGAKMQERG